MTNFNKTLLAAGISLALGFSADALAAAGNALTNDSVSVAVDASVEADIDDGSDGAIAQGGGNATHDQSEAEVEDYANGAAANNGGTAILDQSENTSAIAGGDAFAVQNGGDIDYSNAAATGGDAFSAQDASEIEYNPAVAGRDAYSIQDGGEIDQEVENENSDGSVAVREGDVDFSGFENDLDNDVTGNTVAITPVTPGTFTQSNDITASVNGAAGIVQLSQNVGGIAAVNQSVNVMGTVVVANAPTVAP